MARTHVATRRVGSRQVANGRPARARPSERPARSAIRPPDAEPPGPSGIRRSASPRNSSALLRAPRMAAVCRGAWPDRASVRRASPGSRRAGLAGTARPSREGRSGPPGGPTGRPRRARRSGPGRRGRARRRGRPARAPPGTGRELPIVGQREQSPERPGKRPASRTAPSRTSGCGSRSAEREGRLIQGAEAVERPEGMQAGRGSLEVRRAVGQRRDRPVSCRSTSRRWAVSRHQPLAWPRRVTRSEVPASAGCGSSAARPGRVRPSARSARSGPRSFQRGNRRSCGRPRGRTGDARPISRQKSTT